MKRVNILIGALLVFVLSLSNNSYAQTMSDEVSIMVDVPSSDDMSEEAAVFIVDKLKQICAQNGISNDVFSRFCLTAKLTVLEKNVLGGGQPTISQTMTLVLHIIDNYDKKIFASTSLNISGMGANETKAEINAVKRISNNPKLSASIAEGKQKIVAYYVTQLDNIIAQANNLAKLKQYEAGLYLLCSVPQVVGADGYAKANGAGVKMFGEYINHVGQINLRKAKAIWGANQNAAAANEASAYIAEIYPESSAYAAGQTLFNEICAKVKDDIMFERKMYQDKIDTERLGIKAWRDVGVAYGSGQQPITIRESYRH